VIGGFARAAFFVLLPAIGVGGALGLPVLICLAGAASLRPSLLRQAVESRPAALVLLVLFFALAAMSAAWSEHDAGTQAAKIALLAPLSLLFAAAAAKDPRLTQAGTVAAFAVLGVLLAIEAVAGLPFNRAAQPGADLDELGRNVSRAASFLLTLTWGAVGALAARPGLTWKLTATAALAAGSFISLQFGQFSNTVGFALGLAAFLAAYAAPRLTLIGVIGGLLLWLAAAPLLTPLLASAVDPEAMPRSWTERIGIWGYVCDRIWEQPWFGHGLDAARAHLPAIPVHPHSASLQIWFELGVVGVALAAALLFTGGRELVRRFADNPPAAAAAAGTLTSIGVVANISFNLWAEWWLAAMFLAAGVVGALGRGPR
jgi:O-antigen ligase